tara:strand:+ start:530 stop:679 length:150 start_codon:yes stop_codon:yes gene_type:complete
MSLVILSIPGLVPAAEALATISCGLPSSGGVEFMQPIKILIVIINKNKE